MTSKPLKTVAVLEIATAAGVLLFWLVFFTVGLAPAQPPVGYLAFEHAFPLPDSVLAVTLLAAGTRLLSDRVEQQRAGQMLSLVAAGALIFLGLLDVSFNVQQGMYLRGPADAVLAGLINAWCIGFGGFILVRCGRRA
jgi:hypothetical protein